MPLASLESSPLRDISALALAGIASPQTARTNPIARRLAPRLRGDMMVMV
jgi:hypothetical protein